MNLHHLFFPKTIAVIGASPNLSGGKLPYFQLLRSSGYKGTIYPVNPTHNEIDGSKTYQYVTDIEDSIDLAIVTVPVNRVMATLDDLVVKGVKFVHFFTSGFSEMGNIDIEREMLNRIRGTETRIVGPNCLGVLCAEAHMTFSFKFKQEEVGPVAFLGQSGGLTDIFISFCGSKQIGLNKVVSYGNQIDLCIEDYLEYFAHDNSIKVIAAYIEDIKDGRRFISVLKDIAQRRPVIILKGGSTPSGATAAASHTGAIAIQHQLFSSILRQTGCIEADSLEALVDIVMIASMTKLPSKRRVGFIGGGGGNSVTSADIAVKSGLIMPNLQPTTQNEIQTYISTVNTSTANPVDLGAFGFDMEVMIHTLMALDRDENIDVIIPDFTLGMLPIQPDYPIKKVADTISSLNKPVIPIISKTTEDNIDHEEIRLAFFRAFRKAGIPAYPNMQRAALALQKLSDWRTRFDK